MATGILKNIVPLWSAWWGIVSQLRPAFARTSTFLWFAVALAATCARTDLRGVTSFVRALGLTERCYGRLLDMFHSTAVRRDELPALWSRLALSLLKPFLLLLGLCFLREAPERAIGSDRRAGKWGLKKGVGMRILPVLQTWPG